MNIPSYVNGFNKAVRGRDSVVPGNAAVAVTGFTAGYHAAAGKLVVARKPDGTPDSVQSAGHPYDVNGLAAWKVVTSQGRSAVSEPLRRGAKAVSTAAGATCFDIAGRKLRNPMAHSDIRNQAGVPGAILKREETAARVRRVMVP